MKPYLLALDQGTTSSRCILFDRHGTVLSRVNREFRQSYPQDGWVEQNATEILASQMGVAVEAMLRAGIGAEEIAAIGITNQRETVIVWDRVTGKPICPAIVWQCRRTAERCAELKRQGLESMLHAKTGLIADPYFSATKLQWILENIPDARRRAEAGELCFGTVDSWLIWNLTGGKVHATDPSNAARTMLYNIHTGAWDRDLLDLFGIPEAILPEVKPSSCIFGYTSEHLFGERIPISGAAGDQQAALFGQGCFDAGDVKNTYGTGGFLLMNTGEAPVDSKAGLLTTVGWQLGDRTTYVLEGSVFICGAVIQWLRDGLHLFGKASETEAMATAVPDSAGVYLVPAFVGLGAPYWDPFARGSIQGLTRAVTANHIVRAALESMAYQTADVLEAMRRDAATLIGNIRVDGGASANDFLLQFQSDILGIPLSRPLCVETTAWGAASLAALAVGYYGDLSELRQVRRTDRCFVPEMSEEEREKRLAGWHKAVNRSREWING